MSSDPESWHIYNMNKGTHTTFADHAATQTFHYAIFQRI